MSDRHYVGPVGRILGQIKKEDIANVFGTDTPEARMHALVVRRIAAYWAVRSAGFQLRRFVELSGYDANFAVALAKEVWEAASKKQRKTLETQERVLHIAQGWWRT